MKSIKSPISLDRQKQRQIKSRYPFAITAVIFVVVCLGVFLILASSIRVSGLDKQTALLEKYDGLSDLANDIRNGSVDFANLDDSDGIDAQVMKNSRLYEKADTATKECLDFAGKLGKSLGDHEIVHCVNDSNYFRNKYANSSLSAGDALSALHSTQDKDKVPLAKILYDSDNFADKLVLTGKFNEQEAEQFSGKIKQIIPPLQMPNSDIHTESFEANGQASLTVQPESNRSPTANQPVDNPIIEKLVKTGKFTEQQAGEFANKIRLKGIEIEELTNVNLSDSGTSIKQIPPAQDAKNNLPKSPQNYNDLSRLVSDIKNRHLDADRISLNAFQISGAYKTADKQTQACIDHAGKIGHNLRDTEIVNCFENANHFGNLLSSNTESSKNTSSFTSAQSPNPPITKAAENRMRDNNQENESSSTHTAQTSDNERTKLIDKLVQSGKFTEAEATEFVIIHELVNNENFSEEQAVNFAHNIMKDKKQRINENDNSKVKSGIDKNSDSIDSQSAADSSVNDKARSGDDNRNKDNSVVQENESPASSARADDDNSAVDDKTGNKEGLNKNDIKDDDKGKTNSAVSSKHNDTAEGKKTETDALSKETSGDNNDKELIEKLVGTGKFTEQEAKEFADKKAEKGP